MALPANRGIHGSHWVRYGIAGDQKYLLGEFADTYDQLVVNGNILAHMPAAMSQFLAVTAKKPFVIDPQTHAFQHDLDLLLSTSKKSAGSLKRSWRGLVERYGEPLPAILQSAIPRTLTPDDLRDDVVLDGFVGRVLQFQKDIVRRELAEGPDSHYLRYLAKASGHDPSQVPPAMLVSPYFYIGGALETAWAELTRRCLASARIWVKANAPDLPLAAQVVVSKEYITDADSCAKLARQLQSAQPDVFLFWVDQFSEQAASPQLLNAQIRFVEALADGGFPVINIYGGFFSIAQMKVGQLQNKLHGVCHGLEYGESRPVVPLGGGIPVARFYSNKLHHRMPSRIAQKEVAALGGFESVKAFHEQICACPECQTVITGDPNHDFLFKYAATQERFVNRQGRYVRLEFPTAEAADHCTRHYLWCKSKEYQVEWDKEKLRAELLDASKRLLPHLGAEYAAHGVAWANLL